MPPWWPLAIHTQPFLKRAERVGALRVLCVIINSKLTVKDHLDHLLSSYASSIHLIMKKYYVDTLNTGTLKTQALNSDKLWDIF